MAVTFAGTEPSDWGAPAFNGLGIVLSASISSRVDKKEVKGSQGDVQVVAFFNRRNEVSIEGYGDLSGIEAGGSQGLLGVTCYIDEVTQTYSNEDFVKSSIKGTQYLSVQ